ncbi:uncharacterized protein [Triticum aestivum]|uniref:uncharacterized protein n=1 Tax=Triticum aestivum TaxID=4565 RepID=UPI001D012F3A|nr:uncharacterized protein LOC123082900 [Triticum aestivum]
MGETAVGDELSGAHSSRQGRRDARRPPRSTCVGTNGCKYPATPRCRASDRVRSARIKGRRALVQGLQDRQAGGQPHSHVGSRKGCPVCARYRRSSMLKKIEDTCRATGLTPGQLVELVELVYV